MRPVQALVCALLAAALVGCGDQDVSDRFAGRPERDVAVAVERLGAAVRDGDTAEICSTLLARSITERLGPRCPARIVPALRAVNDPRLEVASVRVRGTTAQATVVAGTAEPPRSGELDLALQGGRWVITGVGPLPPRGG